MIVYMMRVINVLHVIVVTLLSMLIYAAWLLYSDSSTFDISRSLSVVWGSPIFYLVVLFNLVMIFTSELAFSLLQQGKGLRHRVEHLHHILRKPDLRVSPQELADQLTKEASEE